MVGLDFSVWLRPEYLSLLVRGVAVTLVVAGLSSVLAIGLGLALGLARTYGGPLLRRLAGAAIAAGRNVPALVHVFFWAFAVPRLLPPDLRREWLFTNPLATDFQAMTGVQIFYAVALTLGLAINTAGYLAEIFRAGWESIPRPVLDAARATGLGRRALFTSILWPLGLPVAGPAAGNRLIHNFKNTALAAFLPVPDFLSAVTTALSDSFRAIEFLTLAAVFYIVAGLILSRALGAWEKRRLVWQT